jgi:hypothetical protein
MAQELFPQVRAHPAEKASAQINESWMSVREMVLEKFNHPERNSGISFYASVWGKKMTMEPGHETVINAV